MRRCDEEARLPGEGPCGRRGPCGHHARRGLRATFAAHCAAQARRVALSALPVLLALSAAALAPGAHAQRAGTVAGAAAGAADNAATEAPPATGGVPRLNEAEAVRLGQEAIGRPVPDLMLLDRQGRAVRLAGYRGKPLLVSFIYTGCFQICPTQTRALHDAVRGLQRLIGPQQFNVVSIGFNQPFDDPDAMRSFARQHRIDEPNWEFLSPPRAAVAELTRAFGFSYVATPAGFDHVLGVTVVDSQGRIHAQVYGDKLRADQLGRPLRQLLLDAPWGADSSAVSTLAAMVERVRILCTVYDPDTGEYRYDWKLIFELIGGLLFFTTVSIYLLREWLEQRRARRQAQANRAGGSSAPGSSGAPPCSASKTSGSTA